MMKKDLRIFLIICTTILLTMLPNQDLNAQKCFYDYTVKDIRGDEFALAQLQGMKVLVVNTASKCALTPQYEGLERLYKRYGGEDFVILAFPSNDFGRQEPGTDEEIASFCSSKYAVSFPVMAKISVKGDGKHPLYKWLCEASENGVEESRVTWNFQKYMIDEGGTLVGHVPPWKKPENKAIIAWLEQPKK